MRSELQQHLPSTSRILRLPMAAPQGYGPDDIVSRSDRTLEQDGKPLRLLFVGRMDLLKGGGVALEALVHVARLLERPVELTLVGDGPDRERLESRARAIERQEPDTTTVFTGWCDRGTVRSHMDRADVLVVPSVWPEPFGLVGLEAAHHSLPTAAFAVGGIPEWLEDGVNGHLAPPEPPTAKKLGEAIAMCVESEEHYRALCDGARDRAKQIDAQSHTRELTAVLAEAAGKTQ
jgi:glycosyltransferase involved in cell wall biosynthesis